MDDSEAAVLQDIRIELGTDENVRLFRNIVGGFWTRHGAFMRTGLAPGSGDLIGLTAITITPDMVGKKVGVFTSIEVKRVRASKIGTRQRAWERMVKQLGGIAGIVRSVDEAIETIERYAP